MGNLKKNKKKLQILQKVLEDIQFENNKSHLEQYCEVLVENKLDKQEKYFGRTRYMTPVLFEGNDYKPGDLVNVKIQSYNKNNLFGFCKINKVKAA